MSRDKIENIFSSSFDADVLNSAVYETSSSRSCTFSSFPICFQSSEFFVIKLGSNFQSDRNGKFQMIIRRQNFELFMEKLHFTRISFLRKFELAKLIYLASTEGEFHLTYLIEEDKRRVEI